MVLYVSAFRFELEVNEWWYLFTSKHEQVSGMTLEGADSIKLERQSVLASHLAFHCADCLEHDSRENAQQRMNANVERPSVKAPDPNATNHPKRWSLFRAITPFPSSLSPERL